MRQLDLFGFLPDIPVEDGKTEHTHPVLKNDTTCAVSVTKNVSFSSEELTVEMQEGETLENAETVENDEENLRGVEYFEDITSFAENIDLQKSSSILIEKTTIELPVFEIRVQEQKETKSALFNKSEELAFEDKKISAQEKDLKAAAKQKLHKRGRKSLTEIEAEVDLIEIPEDEDLFKKQYYSISEVAKWFRVNASLLRFWEKEFDILKPKKNGKGDRLFRPEDVKNLQLIYQLLRLRKYTIEGAKEYIKTNKKKADNELQLANTLQKFKSFLLDLKANLQ